MNYTCATYTSQDHYSHSPDSSSMEIFVMEELFFSKSTKMDEVLIFILFFQARYSLDNTIGLYLSTPTVGYYLNAICS